MAAKKSPARAKPKVAAKKKAARAKPAWKSRHTTVDGYLESLPAEKRDVIAAARKLVRANIPKGKKFDMGKACLHFMTLDDLELKSLGKVIGSVMPGQYLEMYKRVKGLD
jgi:hypothetical protein